MPFLRQILHLLLLLLLLLLNVVCDEQLSASNLLTNYLPASMQALAYYIDQLQYEPLAATTVEPPFSASLDDLDDYGTGIASITTTTRTPPTSTTARPAVSITTTTWWQPPVWWQQNVDRTTTTRKPKPPPTQPHKPGLFAPTSTTTATQYGSKDQHTLEGYELFNELSDDINFDRLPLSLINDIQTEVHHDEFTNDVESLDNFLRLYDDNYGRAAFDFETSMDRWSSSSTAGKKRVPPTKPYVDFLLVYDLLKRDAKASNLSKYEGYSDELLYDLYELSQVSAQRQLYTLFKRMLIRRDIQRSDVVSRIQGIIKDLSDPNSATSKALKFIPALQFIP